MLPRMGCALTRDNIWGMLSPPTHKPSSPEILKECVCARTPSFLRLSSANSRQVRSWLIVEMCNDVDVDDILMMPPAAVSDKTSIPFSSTTTFHPSGTGTP